MIGSSAEPEPDLIPPPPPEHRILTQEELDRITQYFSDWTAKAFAESAEFTNKMSFAGYTGSFATWLLLKPYLSPSAMLWIGILLMISIVTFVGWNVFNMFWIAWQRFSYLVQLQGLTGDDVRKKHMELEAAIRRKQEQFYLRAWVCVVVVCATTAALAMGILIVTAAVNLLQLSV